MKRTKITLCCLAWFCLLVVTIPGHAWEFEMTGSMNWAYEYYSQRGTKGFFGPYNVDADNPNNTANLNFWWNGPRVDLNLVTGGDAARSYLYVLLEPGISLNQAIKLRSRLRVGQWNNPQASYYNTQDSPGTDNAVSEIQITQFWATAQLPWGTLGLGKRPWKFGTGLQYDGSDGLTTESIVLNSAYGPLDIGFGFYAHRAVQGGLTQTAAFVGSFADTYDLGVSPVGTGFNMSPYFNRADKSGQFITDILSYVVYSSGPFQMGLLGAVGKYHIGPEGTLRADTGGGPPPVVYRALDSHHFHGTAFAKYNNGRFFFNGETAWVYWTDRLFGSGVLGALPTPRYTEQWRFLLETGIIAGSSKVTLLTAWSPGPDRRNGALHNTQSAAFVWHPTFDAFLGNYDVFRPYSWFLIYNYGSGFGGYNLSLDGYLRDAWALAGRVDYAPAANLNVFGSFLYAERQGHGYGWGAIGPLMNPTGTVPDINGNLRFNLNGNINAPAGSLVPNIPDTGLGWEATGGLDWQLLEGFTAGVLVAYWQPGRWFSYACIDRSVTGWRNNPTAANNWGTRPDKTIDPVMGGQVTVNFSF